MKRVFFLAIAFVLSWLMVAEAQVWVDPYTSKDGAEVQGRYRSDPDRNLYNNWSFPGNSSPSTGKQATEEPNRYLEQYQYRNDQGFGTYRNPYYQFQYRW